MRDIVKVGRSFIRSSRSIRGRSGGSFTAVAVLAFALIVSIAGSFITYNELRMAFQLHNAIDTTTEDLITLYRLQIDEETGIRGYMATGLPVYLQPYIDAKPKFTPIFQDLAKFNQEQGFKNEPPLLDQLRATHDEWETKVAPVLIAHPTAPEAVGLLSRGKVALDRMRDDFAQLTELYKSEAKASEAQAQSLLRQSAFFTSALILLFGGLAIIADIVRSRTQAALERERVVADTLQQAFLSGWDSLPYVRIGTAYVSATRDAAVGGDLFDVYRLDEHRSSVLVADVSGKGLNAAVETARVKYSVRSFAEENGDPAVVLSKFNRAFARSAVDPESFVTVFLGILDDRDMSLSFASAGHGQSFLRRGDQVRRLDVTGPVIGLTASSEFGVERVMLQSHDMLVLATDGLTEARDSDGVLLGEEGAVRWIRDGSRDPDRFAKDLVDRVTRFAGGRIADDFALLVIKVA
ncbi:MAG TPA: SpoIIE family protein phosphatase [Candidatus Eremiobacteraceae bacterium]